MSFANTIYQIGKGVAEQFLPTLSVSQFDEKGVLTPEEFTNAGDQLTFRCPSWQWEVGDMRYQRSFLGPKKQYLVTRNVPSLRRAADHALTESTEEVEKVTNDSDEWTVTHADYKAATIADITELPFDSTLRIDAVEHKDLEAAAIEASSSHSHANVAKSSSDIPDLTEFEDEDLLVYEHESRASRFSAEPDMASVSAVPEVADANVNAAILRAEEPMDAGIVRTRTYDIHLVYDKFYQTPRVFLCGFDEHGHPLSDDAIMQDISADHANKTVTMETHPHLGVSMVSIHPCRHAEVMLVLMNRYRARTATGLTVQQYLILFLKFFSSVIPTIEYDYTSTV